ncbi:hypothetical protein HCDG_07001 [Histoplasma capsulatum H143]|uniref:Uncharacterized protein n=1 Tax=Ajellomyces capsulatus (strain H143) TaxID=544712 RepID=C6HLC0_AJECH|nr:hypothetical protein HCDG_07001 [Histoplasma capsulatum H143]
MICLQALGVAGGFGSFSATSSIRTFVLRSHLTSTVLYLRTTDYKRAKWQNRRIGITRSLQGGGTEEICISLPASIQKIGTSSIPETIFA